MSDYCKHDRGQQLYRDRENGIIMGVCSGLSEYFEIETWIVRVAAVICLYFFTTATALAYIVFGLFLRDRPLSYRGAADEHRFWSGCARRGRDYQ